jgi:type I restriction enzyme S subunit
MPEVTLKSGWTWVAFGDVVKLAAERSRNPEEDGFERFVGLDHIDPDDLKIRRWGDIAAGTTFSSVFRPGQVLFGKRRAYQRKVAVADFRGVCSGDIYVLEPKNAHLLPELLPFICQTDGFFEHAVGTSAGSLSPRTNWDSLASYEFALPPAVEQQRIAEVLRAAANYERHIYTTLDSLGAVKSAAEVRLIAAPLALKTDSLDLKTARPTHGWRVCSGQALLDAGFLVALQDGNHGSQYPRASELGDDGIPYIAASDISADGEIDLSACRRIRPGRAEQLRIPPARSGDVILTNNATVGRVTRLPDWPTDIVVSTSTTYYRCDPSLLDPDYLRWFFESAVFQFQLRTVMRQSTRNQVPITTQKRLLFAIPPLETQRSLAAQRARFLESRRALQSHRRRVGRIGTALRETMLV